MLNDGTMEGESQIPIRISHEGVDLPALVIRAFEEAENNARQASALLEQWAKADPELARVILDPHLPTACWKLCVSQCQRNRILIWETPHSDVSGKGERVAYLATENARLLLDMPLPIRGEPLLRDATKEQVVEAAIYYEKISANMVEKSTLLRLIAKKAKEGSVIGQQFTEAALRKLQAQAKG